MGTLTSLLLPLEKKQLAEELKVHIRAESVHWCTIEDAC